MKKHVGWALCGAFGIAALAGCGTVSNMTSDAPVPYGGIAADVDRCAEGWDPNLPHGWFPGEMILVGAVKCGVFLCNLCDVPLSAVGDTVTLPFTLLPQGTRQP